LPLSGFVFSSRLWSWHIPVVVVVVVVVVVACRIQVGCETAGLDGSTDNGSRQKTTDERQNEDHHRQRMKDKGRRQEGKSVLKNGYHVYK
jgi:hypothetical protein